MYECGWKRLDGKWKARNVKRQSQYSSPSLIFFGGRVVGRVHQYRPRLLSPLSFWPYTSATLTITSPSFWRKQASSSYKPFFSPSTRHQTGARTHSFQPLPFRPTTATASVITEESHALTNKEVDTQQNANLRHSPGRTFTLKLVVTVNAH